MKQIILNLGFIVLLAIGHTYSYASLVSEHNGISYDSMGLPKLAEKRDHMANYFIDMNVTYNFIELDQLQITAGDALTDSKFTNEVTYPLGSMISLHMDQYEPGLQSVFIKIDGAPERIYTMPIKLSMKGSHTIAIKIVDQWGNESWGPSIRLKII